MPTRNASEITKAKISAATFAPQRPSTPRISGRISTDDVWKISVRKNEIAAETAPLLSAVKNDDAKMLKPASKKLKEKSLNA